MVSTFLDVVQSRRSIRVFGETPVPEADVRECLRLAALAPSSSNLQPWEFHWVRSPDKKTRLVEACLSQPAAGTAAELIVVVARTKTWRENCKRMMAMLQDSGAKVPKRVITYYTKLMPFALTQGPFGIFGLMKAVAVTVIGLFKPVPRQPVSLGDMRVWAVKSTALAAQNLMLAIRSKGWDSCPMEGFDSVRVGAILNLPRDAEVVMVVGLGKRMPQGIYGPQLRFAADRVVFEV